VHAHDIVITGVTMSNLKVCLSTCKGTILDETMKTINSPNSKANEISQIA
jgi:hypothetical protein